MATVIKRVPPPPPIAKDDPVFNKWLHDLTAFIGAGGGIDVGTIPGYDVLVSTVATHSIQIASHTVDIASLTNQVGVNTSAIATHTSQIATNASGVATNTASIATLAARSQVFSGAAVPSGVGIDGDWYADTAAKHIHVKVGGAWVLIV